MTQLRKSATPQSRTPHLDRPTLIAAFAEPQPTQIARLRVMRQMVRLYYAGLLLAPSVNPAAPIDSLTALTPDEFRASIAGAELGPVSRHTTMALGKMCLARFIAECGAPGYDDALARASEGA